MDSEDNPERADRLKFIVAIMTKDYSNAIDMGISILNREPNDLHVRNCLSALKKIRKSVGITLSAIFGADGNLYYSDEDKVAEMREKSFPEDEATVSTSGTEESDEANSSTDESVDESDDETCTRVIDAAEAHSGAEKSKSSKSIKDCISEAVSASSGTTDGKLFTFREKMYRVLPLRFARKK